MNSLLLRLTLPSLLTGLLLIGTGLGSVWSISRLQDQHGRILSEHVASLQASRDLEISTRQIRFRTLRYLARPTPEGRAQIQADERAFEDAFRRAVRAGNTPEEEALLARIGAGYEKYRDEIERLLDEARAGAPTDFARYDAAHPIRHIVDLCKELAEFNRRQLDQTLAESEGFGRWSRSVLLLVGLAGPVGGVIAGYGYARGLARSIRQLHFRVRDVVERLEPGTDSKGDVQLRLTSGGELGGLDRDLQDVVRRIEGMVERLHRQQREMLRAEQLASVGQLAAGVAHEVRNPLAGMKLLVEAAVRPCRPRPLTDEDLGVIHEEITRLEGIVQHFLDFARPQPLTRRPTDLREALARPVELVRGRARQQGVALSLELPDESLPVLLDGGQFQTVVVNLLLNALDAMPRGGSLTVALAREGGRARIRVLDTGAGIPDELLPRLFAPFATGRATGTGLGLSLARRIVGEHGGSIEASNREEGGACFTILLLLESVERSEGDGTPPRAPALGY